MPAHDHIRPRAEGRSRRWRVKRTATGNNASVIAHRASVECLQALRKRMADLLQSEIHKPHAMPQDIR